MKRFGQEKLLRDVLEGDGLAALRAGSLRRGVQAMRWRRCSRLAWRAGAVVLLPLLMVASLFLMNQERPAAKLPGYLALASTRAESPAGPEPIKCISDEQLFALFPGRSVALIGKPGHQQLLISAGPAAARDSQTN